MTDTTRSLCPLCDWHHDWAQPVPTMPPPGVSIADHAAALLLAETAVVETAIREHLETHPLIEWAKKVALLQRNLAGAEADVQLAMDEWGTSDQRHAKESVAFAAERGAWGTIRQRVWGAAYIADEVDVTDWQRGYRACSQRVMAALDEPVDMVIYDFNAPLRTPATPEATPLPTQATPPSCRWPACLTEADQQQLADDVDAGMRGEETTPGPDPQAACGCVDRGLELTREELQDLVDDLGQQAYRAGDLLDFIREMCDQRDAAGTPITTTDVRGWLAYTGCGGVLRLPDEAVAKLAQRGVETPGCDCGHEDMGESWHRRDCAWRAATPLRTPATAEATNLSLIPPPEFTVRLSGFEILRNEIAAEANTLDRLRAWLATQDPWSVGCMTSMFRFAIDPELPVGEVHMRPAASRPWPAEGGPVPMPMMDGTGRMWWNGKPWPPRDEPTGDEQP